MQLAELTEVAVLLVDEDVNGAIDVPGYRHLSRSFLRELLENDEWVDPQPTITNAGNRRPIGGNVFRSRHLRIRQSDHDSTDVPGKKSTMPGHCEQ